MKKEPLEWFVLLLLLCASCALADYVVNKSWGLRALFIFIALGSIANFFSSIKFEVDASGGAVYVVETRWWGLQTEREEIEWLQPPGFERPGWMATREDGKPYLYLHPPAAPTAEGNS